MSVAWVFPGQGSQMVGMGRDLYNHVPAARAVFDQADSVLDINISRLCFEGPDHDLTATENTQPALLTTSIAVLHALKALAPEGSLSKPGAVAGHSLGEYSALVAGGAMDLPTAIRLVRKRGELMAAAHEGTMAAILGLDDQVLDTICSEASAKTSAPVVIANYNAPGQFVISGATTAVECACNLAKEHGAKRAIPLKVSAAFHSPLMHSAAQEMALAVAAAPIGDVQVPLIANVTATPLQQTGDIRQELVAQVASPVRWIDTIQQMVAHGITTFIEMGPGTVLTGLIKRIAPQAQVRNVRTVEDIQSLIVESH